MTTYCQATFLWKYIQFFADSGVLCAILAPIRYIFLSMWLFWYIKETSQSITTFYVYLYARCKKSYSIKNMEYIFGLLVWIAWEEVSLHKVCITKEYKASRNSFRQHFWLFMGTTKNCKNHVFFAEIALKSPKIVRF